VGWYTGFPWPVFLKISGAMYPGVPQVVVRTWNCSSSMMRERPKSAMRSSAWFSGVRKRRFSGLRSVCIFLLVLYMAGYGCRASVYDPVIVKICNCAQRCADEIARI
jgi:hypothetical protein